MELMLWVKLTAATTGLLMVAWKVDKSVVSMVAWRVDSWVAYWVDL